MQKEVQNIRHLLVDLDGTLLGAHDLKLVVEFTVKGLVSIRKHGSWLQSLQALRAIFQELDTPSQTLNNRERSVKVFSEQMGLSYEEAKAALDETVTTLFPKLEKHFYPIADAQEFLQWAKTRYPLTLATNPVWTEEIVKLRMRWAKIDPELFHTITHSEKMHACKPSPEYYKEILAQQNLQPQECLLIGNDLKKDLPATSVGIPVFIVDSSSRLKKLQSKSLDAWAWTGTFPQLKSMLEA